MQMQGARRKTRKEGQVPMTGRSQRVAASSHKATCLTCAYVCVGGWVGSARGGDQGLRQQQQQQQQQQQRQQQGAAPAAGGSASCITDSASMGGTAIRTGGRKGRASWNPLRLTLNRNERPTVGACCA
jgi:hypothetical protein